jgi:hypothetical protein
LSNLSRLIVYQHRGVIIVTSIARSIAQALTVILLIPFVVGCSSAQPQTPTAEPTPGQTDPLFNFEGKDKDFNGFPRNPTWSGQHGDTCADPYVCNFDLNGGRCNTQMLSGAGTDTARRSFWRALFTGTLFHYTCEGSALANHFPGHVNIGLATYEGTVAWDGISVDGDYDFRLFPIKGGVTDSNRDFVHVEFDSDETINQLDALPPWWDEFRVASLKFPNDGSVDALIGPRPYAVMTGLVGFDCEHDCHSELHPIYAIAIRRPPSEGVERWSILVRNWGTEGWCSSLNHVIGSRVSILLPYQSLKSLKPVSGQTAFKVYKSRGEGFLDRLFLWLSRNEGLAAMYPPRMVDSGVELTFELPDWRSRSVVVGELAFTTNEDAVAPQASTRPCVEPPSKAVTAPATYDGDEDRANRLLRHVRPGSLTLATQRADRLPDPLLERQPQTPFYGLDAVGTSAWTAVAVANTRPEKGDLNTRRIRQICTAVLPFKSDFSKGEGEEYAKLCPPQ